MDQVPIHRLFRFSVVCFAATAMSSSSTVRALNPGAFAGTWKGKGNVMKKTGEIAATYLETATFEIVRKTPEFIVYRMHQDTKNEETSKPMHTETGFCKILTHDGEATMTQAHPFPSGFISELAEGKLEGNTLKLVAKDFQRAVQAESNNKQVTGFQREYTVTGEKLIYNQFLSSGGCSLYHHLHCELEREQS